MRTFGPAVVYRVLFSVLLVVAGVQFAIGRVRWENLGVVLVCAAWLALDRWYLGRDVASGEAKVIEELARRIQALEIAHMRMRAGVDE